LSQPELEKNLDSVSRRMLIAGKLSV
jgi:hypothetical protein